MALTKIGSSGLDTNAITSDKITADSITEAKIADAAVENEHLNTKIITDQTELAEAAASTDVLLIYDTSIGALKKIQASNVGVQPPIISSISPTNVDSKDSATTTTFTVTGTGFTAGTTAKLKNNSGSDINFNTVTRDSNTQLTCVLNNGLITGEGLTDEPYDVVVTAGNNLSAVLENQINVDQRPVFVTTAGSLGSQRVGTFTATVEATDPESAGAVRYDVVGGALPAGITLNTSTGVISGSITLETSDTTYNFTIQASDIDSNVSFRDFSITLQGPQITSFTASGTFSVPTGLTSLDVLVVAGGGGGGPGSGAPGGGAGAGGLIFRPAFPVTPGGTITVTVGDGAPSNSTANNGQDSVFGTLTAKGGGYGGKFNAANGGGGGSGGGGSAGGGGGWDFGTATQPTQPGDSGTYGFGNNGGGGSPTPTASGGGGAGAAGQPGPGGSAGGAGLSYTIADGTTPVFYAGGGGGAPSGAGGNGGGGAASGNPGVANRGGGGAGATNPGPGGGGGKGIVIVKF